jgi:hypothetical protein
MSVSIIGMISHRRQSKIIQPQGPRIDLDYLDSFAGRMTRAASTAS